jgi:hypothetical protein
MGVDSVAMLVGMHQRGERPDLVLFADTGGEKPETYDYIPILQAWLAGVGFPPVTTVVRVVKRFKNAPYTTLEGNCISNKTLPSIAFFARKACSQKWKKAPQDKFCKAWAPAVACWAAGGKVQKLIGYDAGPKDARRCWKIKDDKHYTYRYPLRDWGWDRERCIAEIAKAGLPVPMKSACFFCSVTQEEELDWLCKTHPDLAQRIMRMEAVAKPNLRVIDGLWMKGRKGSGRPGTMTEYITKKHHLPLYDPSKETP